MANLFNLDTNNKKKTNLFSIDSGNSITPQEKVAPSIQSVPTPPTTQTTVIETKKPFIERDVPSFIAGYGASGITRMTGAMEEIFFKGLGKASKIGGNIGSKVYKTVGKAVDIFGGSDDNIFNKIADDFYNQGIKSQQLFNKQGRDISHMLNTSGEEFKEDALSKSTGYQKYKEKGQTDTEFNWKDVGSKEFLMYDLMGNLVENAPTMLASLYATKGLGGFGKAGSKLYQYSKLANQIGTGTSIANGMNAFIEGETAYDQALKNNLSEDDAIKRFENVIDRNFGTNTALELIQLTSIFAPSVKTSSKLLNGVIKTGRFLLAGGIEAGQERIEDKIQETAGDDELKIKDLLSSLWKKGITKTDAISFVTGLLFQGMGNAFVNENKLKKASDVKIQSILDNISPDVPPPSGGSPTDKLEQLIETNPEAVEEAVSRSNRQMKNSLSVLENRKIEEDARSSVDILQASQQALQEAGMVPEETKTPEVVTEQPKVEKTQEQSLIEEARQYKTVEEFASGISKITGDSADKIQNIKKLSKDEIKNKANYIEESSSFNGATIYGFYVNENAPFEITINKKGDKISSGYAYSKESQLEDIWNKAQGEAKMKVKGETKKVTDQIDEHIKEKIGNVVKLAYDYKNKKGSPDLEAIQMAEDLEKLAKKSGPLSSEDRANFNELVKRINQEDYLPSNALDTLTTKEDNKEYEQGKRYNRRVDEGIQNDENGDKRGDTKPSLYSLETEGWRQVPIVRRQTQGYTEPTNRQLPNKKEPGEIKKIVSEFLHDAKLETVNKIVDFYIKADEVGMLLTIQRTNVLNGRSDFAAGMDSSNTEFVLSLKDSDMANIKPSDIRHEWGHSYWSSIGDYGRQDIWSRIKWDYKKRKELYDTFEYKDMYWADNIKFIKYHIYDANLKAGKTAGSLEVNPILREVGLLDENNKVLIPEDVIEASFNFGETNKKINELLAKNGLETSKMTEEYNTLMADEINAFIFENIEEFNENPSSEAWVYTNSIMDNNLKFKYLLEPLRVHPRRPGTDIEYGGTRLKLRPSTGLTSEDILKKHANIQLKRDIVITDVYGEKATLKAGEGITPYEVTGNKFILQDGEAYLVSKSQAQNVINNSKTGEAKPFAPELKQTEETIKGGEMKQTPRMKAKQILDDAGYVFEEDMPGTEGYLTKDGEMVEYDDLPENIRKAVDKYTGSAESVREIKSLPTKYSKYTLPGGENYKEILIKAPTKNELNRDVLLDRIAQEKYAKNYADLSAKEQTVIEKLETEQYKPSNFKSSHWDEPNVIAHIRMNERTYDGKKVAFMEELQSDFAREQRKQQKDNLDIIDSKWDSLLDEMSNDGILSVVC